MLYIFAFQLHPKKTAKVQASGNLPKNSVLFVKGVFSIKLTRLTQG